MKAVRRPRKWLTRRSGIGFDGLGPMLAPKAGVLRQVSAGTYDRQYAADELFELIEDCEATVAGRSR